MNRTKQQQAEDARHEIDWKPVRHGDVYCSPLCGGGCRIEAYERAVDVSNKIAADLGPGWKGRVWENLGWHASVISPCRRIRISLLTLPRDTDYMAFLGPVDEYDTCSGKWAESGRTPREAITNVLNAAKRDLGLITETIEGLDVPALPKRKHGGGWIQNCGYCGNQGTYPGKCPKCGRKKR